MSWQYMTNASFPSDEDRPKLTDDFDARDLEDVYKWIEQQCNEKPIADLIDHIQSLSKFAKKGNPKERFSGNENSIASTSRRTESYPDRNARRYAS